MPSNGSGTEEYATRGVEYSTPGKAREAAFVVITGTYAFGT